MSSENLTPADAPPYADILYGTQSDQEATGCGIKPVCPPPRDGETQEQIRNRGLQAAAHPPRKP